MTLTARPRFLIRFAVLAALALCGVVLALYSTGTPPVGAQDGPVPAKPTGVVTTATHDSVALAWDDPSDASITHYQIFRRDRDVHDTGEFVEIDSNTGSAATSYTDANVEPEGSYVYRVKAVNQHGASTWSNFVRADTPAAPDPADLAPSGLVVSLVENRVTLTWDAPASDAASVTGYEILRRRPNEGEAALTTLVADTGNAETGYTDDTANEPGVSYTYRVKALRDGEQSKVSNYARIDLPEDYAQDSSGSDEPTPSPEALAPSNLKARGSGEEVTLTWTAPAEDAGSVTGYEVLRGQGDGDLETLVADTQSTGTDYTDSDVSGNLTDYRYQVRAQRSGEASQGSNVAEVLVALAAQGDATGVPTITGTPAVGELLTADISNIGDADGIADADFEYQWTAFDGSTDSDISGATGETYRPLLAHVGQTIKVRVSFDDDNDNAESLTSAATAAVTASTYGQVIWAATLTVEEETVSDKTFFGYNLFAGRGSLEPVEFTYDGVAHLVTALQYIEGDTLRISTNHSLGSEDFNLYLDGAPLLMESPGLIVDFSDHGLTWTDEQKVEVRLTVNRPATGALAITGKPEVGETLTASISGIMDEDGLPAAAQFAYQWISNDGTDDSDIDGTTDSTYTLVEADAGKSIKVRVSFTDNAKFPESLTSAPTAAVTVPVAALVSNMNQTTSGSANSILHDGAQAFTTGTNSFGYTLESVEISLTVGGSPFPAHTLSIWTESSNSPGSSLGTLTNPDPVVNGVNTYTTTDSISLSANTTYFIVVDNSPNAGDSGRIAVTGSDSEDSGAASGWSIGDGRVYRDHDSTGSWGIFNNSLKIRINGQVIVPPPEVPADSSLVPDGLGPGDQFRLIFLSSETRTAEATDIATYNVWVQGLAANGHADIQDHSSTFRVVGSTAAVDARDNTSTTYTSSDKGVAIYWLNGDKAADDYEDFYDETWDQEATMWTEAGTSISAPANVWTGSFNDGTEYLFGSTSRALGASTVRAGNPDSNVANDGPISGNNVANTDHLPLYALSGVFRVGAIEVPADWSLIPSGLQEGDQFRLLFISSTHRNASPSEIATYNTWIQDLAANGHTDIQDYSSSFRAVGSTEDMDARDNTGTTYTSSDKGVAIYWLGGNKVADDYEDFYDEDWDEEAAMKNESGTAETGVSAWTGSDHDGTEMLQGTPETSRALGNSNNAWVRFGKTDSASHGPLSGETAARGGNKRIYGLSSVFEVVAANNPATGAPTITGFPQLGKTLTADASTIVDPDGTTGATFTYQWVRSDDGTDTDITSATATTYTLVEADVGKLIKVKVSFTDDEDNAESVTSEPVGPVGRRVIDSAGNVDAKGVWFEPVAGGDFIIRLSDDEDDQVYGYTTGPITHSPSHGFDLHADNGDAQGIAAADGVLYVADSGDDKLFAYNVGSTGTFGERLTGNEFVLHTDNQEPAGVWTDGEILYVVDPNEDKVFAYNVGATGTFGASLTDKDVPLHADNDDPWGVWSTGTVIWVADRSDYFIYAYSLSADGVRLDDQRPDNSYWEWALDTTDNNTDPWGMWSNDDTLWVLDDVGSKLFAYYLPLPSEPAPPTGVDITTEGNGELTVGWTAPTDDGGSAITGYNVQWKSGSESFGSSRQHTTADGSARSYKITMLTNGTEYTVRVLAVNAKDDSDASNTDTGTPSTTPSAPTSVQASGNAELVVTWDAPNNGGSAITGYTVQWKSGSESYSTTRQATVTTTTNTIPTLTNGTTYTLRVKATNANGDSDWTETTGTPASGPGVGTVTSGSITQTSAVITVTISNPDTNSQTVNLQYKRNADTNWTSGGARSTVSAAVTFTLSGLTGNTDYDVRASLDSAFDSGVVTATFKTSPTAPGKTRGVSVNFTADGQVSIIWQEPLDDGGSALTGYKVQWKSGAQSFGGDPSREDITGVTPPRSYVITGLTNGTEYTVRVIAVNAVGDGPPSDEATGTPARQPDVPSNVLASGNAELTVTWDAPNDGGSAITGYTVQWKSGTQNYNTTRQATVTTTTHTIPTLTNDTTYTLRVKATNAFGDSDWTETTGTPVSGPGVASVTVDQASITQTSAAVTVTVANLQNASHTVYLRYRVEGGSWPSAANQSTPTSGTAVTFTLTGLTGNTEYDVAASLDSAFASGVKTASFTTSPTKPGKTRNVVTTSGNGQFVITWAVPSNNGGSAITGYKLQWKSGTQSFGDPSREHIVAASLRGYHITGLTNGTEYTARVIAVNAVGDGPPSDEKTATPVGPPDAPPNVQAGSGHQQLTVSWGEPNDRGSAITEYKLQWKSGGQSFNSSRQRTIAAPSRTDTIPSLTNGTEYTVRVRATNASGDSGWSAQVKGTPREGPHVSLVKVKEPISCTVTFVALEFANLDSATEYQAHLRFRAQGSSNWTVLSPQGFWSSSSGGGALNGPSPAFTLTDLAYETTYVVQAALDSGFVKGLAATTFSTPNLSEVGLMPLSPGDGTLGLRMTRPTSEGRVDGYLLQWKSGDEEYDDKDTSQRQADVPGSGDREYTITGLDNGVEYTVRAMAYNDNGVGVPSSEVRGTPEAPPNSPARGAPTISGTAQVGETLTADTDGIEDDDGLADAVYSYQWLADNADISGATGETYTPVYDDQGKVIRVKVSFIDDRDFEETLTSEPTAAVEADPDAPTEPPNAPRTVRIVGDTNTSLTLTWDAPDGGTAVTEYRVQWLTLGEGFANARRDGREAVLGASARSHTITGLTKYGFYQVRVLVVNGAGESEGSNTAWGFPGLGEDQYGP